jgi:Uma2 family endonuclease
VQLRIGYLLIATGAERYGQVGTEGDAAIGKRDGTRSKLIPDVSFILPAQQVGLSKKDLDIPPFSPAIAIEVWSRGDTKEYLARKFARYLATGSQLVLDVRIEKRQVIAHTHADVTVCGAGERFTNAIFPWFAFDVDELFSVVS